MTKMQLRKLLKDGDVIEATQYEKDGIRRFTCDTNCYFKAMPLDFEEKTFFPSIKIRDKLYQIFNYLNRILCDDEMYKFKERVELLIDFTPASKKEEMIDAIIAKENSDTFEVLNHNSMMFLLAKDHFESDYVQNKAWSLWIVTLIDHGWNILCWLKLNYVGKEKSFENPVVRTFKAHDQLRDSGFITDTGAKIFQVLLQIEKNKFLQGVLIELTKPSKENKSQTAFSYNQISILYHIEQKPLYDLKERRKALALYAPSKNEKKLSKAYNDIKSINDITKVGNHSNALTTRIKDLEKIMPYVSKPGIQVVKRFIEVLQYKKTKGINK